MAANTPILALPYPTPDDTVDVPRDVQALATKLDGISALRPPIVSSLPGSPTDGQEIYYVADTTLGILWHLRYRSASAHASKWEVVGVSRPLRAAFAGTRTTGVLSSGVWFSDASSPTITAPLAGEYLVTTTLGYALGNAGVGIAPGLQINGVDVVSGTDPLAWLASQVVPGNAKMDYVKTIGASQVFRQRIWHSAGTTYNITFGNEVLTAVPLRVG